MGWDALLAMLAGGQVASTPPATPEGGTAGENDMKRSELIAALKAALAEEEPAPAPEKKEGDGGGEMNKADLVAALKKALAEDAPPPSEGDEPPPAKGPAEEDEAKKAAAMAEAVKAHAAAQPAAGAAGGAIIALEARVHAMEEEKRVSAEKAERSKLISERTMSAETRKWLEDPNTTITEVRAACKALPMGPVTNPLAASAQVVPARGMGQGGDNNDTFRPGGLPKAEAARLAASMGVTTAKEELRWERNDRVFPTQMSREDAQALLKNHEAQIAEIQRGLKGGA
jgi:hypothetical protein